MLQSAPVRGQRKETNGPRKPRTAPAQVQRSANQAKTARRPLGALRRPNWERETHREKGGDTTAHPPHKCGGRPPPSQDDPVPLGAPRRPNWESSITESHRAPTNRTPAEGKTDAAQRREPELKPPPPCPSREETRRRTANLLPPPKPGERSYNTAAQANRERRTPHKCGPATRPKEHKKPQRRRKGL